MPRYLILLDGNTPFEIEQDAAQPARLLVERIRKEQGLPSQDTNGTPYIYDLLGGDQQEYYLSSEQPLQHTPFKHGGTLYLRQTLAPWKRADVGQKPVSPLAQTTVFGRRATSKAHEQSANAQSTQRKTPDRSSPERSSRPAQPHTFSIAAGIVLLVVALVAIFEFSTYGLSDITVPTNNRTGDEDIRGRATGFPELTSTSELRPTREPTPTPVPSNTPVEEETIIITPQVTDPPRQPEPTPIPTPIPTRVTPSPPATTPLPAKVMPNIVGLYEPDAYANVEGLGFPLEVTRAGSHCAPYIVIEQYPAAGTPLYPGDYISMNVCPALVVPDLRGKDIQKAWDMLDNAGFDPELSEGTCDGNKQDGQVWATDPGPGASAGPGATVTIYFYTHCSPR